MVKMERGVWGILALVLVGAMAVGAHSPLSGPPHSMLISIHQYSLFSSSRSSYHLHLKRCDLRRLLSARDETVYAQRDHS
jgi:hypothetical protein